MKTGTARDDSLSL